MTSVSRRSVLLSSAVLLLGNGMIAGGALASNHFETMLVRDTPDLNITDMYVFPNPARDHTVVIIDVNSQPDMDGKNPYHRDALYNIHLALNDEYDKGMTLSFTFDGLKGKAYLLDHPNGDVGATGAEIGAVTVGQDVTFDNGIRILAGLAKDPFFGNSPALGIFRAQQAQGSYDPELWGKASGQNIFSGRICAPIVAEIPNTLLGDGDIRVFSTSAYRNDGVWEQAQYVGLPLVAHITLFESEVLKSAYARTRPTSQEEFRSIMAARIARSAAFANSQKAPFAYADETTDRLVPNVQRYKPGSDAVFTTETLNGRPLDADAMSVMLTLLIGEPTDQKIENPGLYTDSFPYIIPVSAG
ncbi:DUF4331 family protein [Paracoccus onubensis]|uniref:DUF4331 domain-containing protein n=1 Tax=Paracoccus onubensis TaxID=1675788 RepID=A0A418SM81_9RHOB|nr:DUF4331 family protein [Paracoccus onubensis]RJE82068.1 DUF4331 domain-containing protein [Paracoccus onubensis]